MAETTSFYSEHSSTTDKDDEIDVVNANEIHWNWSDGMEEASFDSKNVFYKEISIVELRRRRR